MERLKQKYDFYEGILNCSLLQSFRSFINDDIDERDRIVDFDQMGDGDWFVELLVNKSINKPCYERLIVNGFGLKKIEQA